MEKKVLEFFLPVENKFERNKRKNVKKKTLFGSDRVSFELLISFLYLTLSSACRKMFLLASRENQTTRLFDIFF